MRTAKRGKLDLTVLLTLIFLLLCFASSSQADGPILQPAPAGPGLPGAQPRSPGHGAITDPQGNEIDGGHLLNPGSGGFSQLGSDIPGPILSLARWLRGSASDEKFGMTDDQFGRRLADVTRPFTNAQNQNAKQLKKLAKGIEDFLNKNNHSGTPFATNDILHAVCLQNLKEPAKLEALRDVFGSWSLKAPTEDLVHGSTKDRKDDHGKAVLEESPGDEANPDTRTPARRAEISPSPISPIRRSADNRSPVRRNGEMFTPTGSCDGPSGINAPPGPNIGPENQDQNANKNPGQPGSGDEGTPPGGGGGQPPQPGGSGGNYNSKNDPSNVKIPGPGPFGTAALGAAPAESRIFAKPRSPSDTYNDWERSRKAGAIEQLQWQKALQTMTETNGKLIRSPFGRRASPLALPSLFSSPKKAGDPNSGSDNSDSGN